MEKLDDITGDVIGCAMEVHNTLGPGFLESVYQVALDHEMNSLGISHQPKFPINVYYKEILAAEFEADFLVEEKVIVEIKAVETLVKKFHVQTVNYLKATKLDIGLLINFGAPSLQFHKKFRNNKNAEA